MYSEIQNESLTWTKARESILVLCLDVVRYYVMQLDFGSVDISNVNCQKIKDYMSTTYDIYLTIQQYFIGFKILLNIKCILINISSLTNSLYCRCKYLDDLREFICARNDNPHVISISICWPIYGNF